MHLCPQELIPCAQEWPKWRQDCSKLISAGCKLVGEADEGPKVSAAAGSWELSNGIDVITDTVALGG